jgi:antitoxin component YwqK of YwqJK toxin-antitoxin module
MIKLFGLHTILILALVLMSVNSAFLAQNPADNINQKDSLHKKQGYWKIYAHMRNVPGYKPEEIIEEGNYLNDRKTGLWIKYYPGGTIQSKLYYQNGKINGYFEVYYSNGCMEESGEWTNGKMKQYIRYRPNCGDSIKGEVIKKDTLQKIVKYSHSHIYPENQNPKKDSVFEVPVLNDSTKGFTKFYDKNKNTLLDGYFENGKLKEGKHYVYDEYGLLEKIMIYIDFQYVGNSVD